jgi:hypothetical protein
MTDNMTALINTRLQPGDESVRADEPFQRLVGAGETVETVLTCFAVITGLKPGVNETVCCQLIQNPIR